MLFVPFVAHLFRGRKIPEVSLRNWTGRQQNTTLPAEVQKLGQPVKLSNERVDDARAVVPFSHRSRAGQIEFWAALGKAIEPLLRGDAAADCCVNVLLHCGR